MSSTLYIEPTENTPLVVLDKLNDKFEIIGVSIPQDGREFYQPILDWLNEYSKTPNKSMEFVINLDYFNISSSKMILFILYKLQEIQQNGKEVKVKWFFNSEELLEAGEDYQFISKLNFEYIETSKEYLVS
jgi:hypothetical protein